MTLARILPAGVEFEDTQITQEALTCIANSLLLKESMRDIFNKHYGVASTAHCLQHIKLTLKCEFLFSRILFLMTVLPNPAVAPLVDTLNIAEALEMTINNHVKELSSPTCSLDISGTGTITRPIVLNEQLKLLFNLMMNDPKASREDKSRLSANATKFERLLTPTIHVITKLPTPSPLALSPPRSHAVHALLNFPVEPYKEKWFPPEPASKQYAIVEVLLTTLKDMIFIAVVGDPDQDEECSKYGVDLDNIITPLVVLFKKLAEEDETAKNMLCKCLMPVDIDRSKPLEKGSSLSARLIRLMTSVMLPHLRDSVSELLFELSNSDPSVFVHHVGYGNAAGFLLNRNILVPSMSLAKESIQSDRPINPITGQYQDEMPANISEMTDEEKEHEAERLFVLFERLKKIGVKAVNPVQEAVSSGRIRDIEEAIEHMDKEREKKDIN